MEENKTDKSAMDKKVDMEAKAVIGGGISLSNELIMMFKKFEASYIKNKYVVSEYDYINTFMEFCFSLSKNNGLMECVISRTIIRTILESHTPFSEIKNVELVSKDDDYLIEWKIVFLDENETVN